MQDGATQQEYCEIGQDGGMAGIEMWCVRTTIDIGRDNSVEIAPSDDDSEGDATLICACLWISPCNHSSRFQKKKKDQMKLPSTLLLVQEMVLATHGYMPIAPRKVPAYRTPAVLAPKSMENPTTPNNDMKMLHSPRCWVRSAM